MNDADDTVEILLSHARRAGATAADVVAARETALSCRYRMGAVESLERAERLDVGLRVLDGRRQAIVSLSGAATPDALRDLAERAVAMARAVPEDPHAGLAAPEQLLSGDAPDLDLDDPSDPTVAALTARAAEAEDAARAVPGVVNSSGAEADWSRREVRLAATNGFDRAYTCTGHSVGVSVIARSDAGMETDWDWHAATRAADLESPAALGRSAGERAVARLNPVKGRTARMPVVFSARVAGALLGSLLGAINGRAVASGATFLKDSMGARILPAGVSVVDDPLRPRGLASRPFDAEGLPAARRALVADGVLRSWVLDLATARRLGLDSTGAAARGPSSAPSPAVSNAHMTAGAVSPDDLMSDIKEGLYVTALMGMGVNLVTGGYSQGAAGFLIERGRRARPVSEITIAGTLPEMLRNLTPANDLAHRRAVNAPTLRVDGMTVAGT